MEAQTETIRAQKAKTVKVSSVKASALKDRELLHTAFLSYHNNFELSKEIEAYCTKNSLDKTYLGIANGNLYKGISKRQSSFSQLQKLGLLNKEGKDSYGNHLVIPTLEGMQVISLEFVDIRELSILDGTINKPVNVLPLSDKAFRVDLNGRLYHIQGLVKSEHQLKATVKLLSGKLKHVDVVNFYSSGNRKRLIRDICELFLFPFEDVKSDIIKLMELCENYETKKNPQLSEHANELLMLFSSSAHECFSAKDIEDAMLWNHAKTFRALKELIASDAIQKVVETRPIQYRLRELMNKLSVDLQGHNKST